MRLSPSLQKTINALRTDIGKMSSALDNRMNDDSIAAELRLLRDDIKQLNAAIKDAAERHDEKPQQEPPVLRAELQVPEAIETQRNRRDDRQYRIHVAGVVATTLAFFAATLYAGIAYEQWREMIGATNAAYRSADQARRGTAIAASGLDASRHSAAAAQSAAETSTTALNNTQRSFQIDERPYIVHSGSPFWGDELAPNKKLWVNLWLANIGKTPATKRFAFSVMIPFHPLPNIEDNKKKVRKFLSSEFAAFRLSNKSFRKAVREWPAAQTDLAPQDKTFITNLNEVVVGADDFASMTADKDQRFLLFYLGIVTYSDAFGKWHETDFCFNFTGSNPNVWHICDAYNSIR